MNNEDYDGLHFGADITDEKPCYCFRCNKAFHPLGIARHRAMHREKKENCMIRYKNGQIIGHWHNFKEDVRWSDLN